MKSSGKAEIADRRAFLRRAAALAGISVAAAFPAGGDLLALDNASVLEREALVAGIVNSMQHDLRSPAVQAALAGTAQLVIRPLLSTLRLIDLSTVLGTRYDVSEELLRFAVQFTFGKGRDGQQKVGFIPASAGLRRYVPPSLGYGNGFYWGRKDRFITALHVFDMAESKPENHQAIDIKMIRMPPDLHAGVTQIVVDDPTLMDSDLHCSYVAVAGIDPDETSIRSGSVRGCKIYPGVAIRLTRAWVNRAFANADPYFRERLYRSFMMLLPSGEAKGKGATIPATGMSGSLVLMLRNGRMVPAGMLHSVYEAPPASATGSMLDLGFFYGPEAIRQKVEESGE